MVKNNCFDTKIVFAFVLMILMSISGQVMAQPGTMFINQDVSGTYSNSTCTAKGNDFQFRIQENGSGTSSGTRNWQFNSDSYYNTWGATSSNTLSAFNTAIAPSTSTASANFQGGPGYNANGKLPATTANYYYTYNIVKGSSYASQSMAVLQTSYNPVTIVSQSLDQTAYGPTNTPIVKVTTSAAPSAGEYVYVRYSTTSNFTTSSLAAVTFSGVNGTSAALSAQAAGTTVYYYIFSSPISTAAAIGTNYDVLMLNLLNNSGSNYSYTVLSYCANTSTSSTGYINSFNTTGGLTNVTNNTTGYTTGGYTDYTTLSPSVSQYIGSSVTANISLGSGTGGTGMAVYIDWNQNGVFTDAGELVYNPGYIFTTTAQSASITVPSGALTGTTRMRVVTDFNLSTPLSCRSGTQKGEAEDYSFTVVAVPVPTISSYTPTALCSAGGQTVTITGTNFVGITSVKFNGTAATSYTVVSTTSITAVVPSGVTAGSITVTNASGTATSSAYTVTSAPTITSNPSAASVSLYATGTGTGTFTAATSTGSPTYQWQYATASTGPWANVATGTPSGVTYSGATSATLSAACTATTPAGSANYYQCVITSGGCSSTTTSAQFTISNYCIPSSTSSSTYINSFSTTTGVTNITNNTTGYTSGGYASYVSQSASQYPNTAINWSVTMAGGTAGIAIWVDWNNNGVFTDAGENVYNSAAYQATGVTTGSFTVPNGQAVGSYRMRVMTDFNATSPVPCTINASGPQGEVEDYTFNVAAPPAPTITSFTPTALCSAGGQTVTITGTNFTGATAVKFNGTAAASYSVVSSTSITAVTPATFTAGNITVITAGGTATSGSAYTLNPSPTITGNPSATSVNAYASATATFTAATSTGSPTYQWQYATSSSGPWTNVADGTPTGITYSSTGTTASLSAVSTTSAVAGSAYYYHCVITAGGCNSTTSAAQLTIINYCYPTTSSASTYINSFSTTSGITNITNTATGYTTGGYANYTAQSASQYPNTAINWSVTLVGGTAGIAIWVDWNNNGVFTDAGENVYNSGAYQATGVTTGSFTVPSGQAAGNYRMRVLTDYSATTPVSCSYSGTRGEAEDYTFTVTALAVPTITSLGSSTGCTGSSLTINGTNLTGATAANVKIGGTAVTSITSNTGTVLVVVVGSGTTGTVAVTTAGGTATSSGTYTFATAPTAGITGTTPGCSSVTLTATPSSGVTYAWSSGGSTTSTSTFSTSGTYLVTVTDLNACTASATQTIVVNTPIAITTQPSTGTQTLCSGGTVTALSVAATGTSRTYQWYSNTTSSNSGGTLISGATSTSYTPSNTLVGTTYYYCIVSGASPCAPLTSNVSGGITVNAIPTAGITGSTTACTTVSLTATGGATYTWSGGSSTSTAANTFSTSGNYTVTATTSGCSSTVSAAVTVNTAPPTPTMTPTSVSVCTGATSTLKATSYTAITTSVLSQNFDAAGLPTGWARSNGYSTGYTDWPNTSQYASAGNTWSAPHGGANCMYFYSYLITAAGTGTLETPAMDLSSYSAASLSFWIYNTDGTDVLKVFAKQGSGTYAQLNSTSYGVYGSWTQITIPLTSFVGTGMNAVKIEFQGTSDFGSTNIGLDDVSVTGTSGAASAITWSPITDLYTNSGATVGYGSGANDSIVYTLPTTSYTYTATATAANGCTSTNTVVVTKVANSWTGTTSTDWNVGTNWCSGTVPTSTTDVIIPSGTPHQPTIGPSTTFAAVCNNITINSGAALTMSNTSSLTVSAGATFQNNGTFSPASGTTVSFAGAGTVSGANATTFGNLTINTGTVTIPTTSGLIPNVSGTLLINGGNISAAVIYGSSSTLEYNVSYGRYVEWNATGVGTIGTTPGYPNNVLINAGTYDVYNSASGVARALAGTLTVTSGATMNFNGMNAAFTVGGNVVVGGTMNMNTMSNTLTSAGYLQINSGGALNMNTMSSSLNFASYVLNNGTLALSSAGGGDIYTGGSWTRGSTGTFTPNTRAVFFTGSGTEVVTVTGGGTETFNYLVVGGSGTMQIASGTTVWVNYSGGLTLSSTNSTSTIDLNGQTMILFGGGNLNLSSGGRYITSSTGTGTFEINSNLTTVSGLGTLTFVSGTVLDLKNGFDGGGSGAVHMNSKLQIDAGGYWTNNGHAPTYGSGSILNYNTGSSFTAAPSAEWYENTVAQPGVPYDVVISTSGSELGFNSSGFKHEMWGDLTINTGTTLALHGGSGNAGADFYIKGNWYNSGTFTGNGRMAAFNGTTAQALTGATTFDYFQITNSAGLTINNDITIDNVGYMTTGIITTGSNKVITVSSASGALTGQSASSYILGNVQRAIAASTGYDFPVGDGTHYQLATIYLNSILGMSNIVGKFTTGAPATGPSPSTCLINNTPITSMLDGGYWTLTPDAGTANYDLTLNEAGYSTTPSVYHLGLIKRHDASSPWLGTDLAGTNGYHSNANSSVISGVASVKRTGITSFSDYGIGSSTTYALPVKLLYFTAVNKEDKGQLAWATATEVNNDHFEIERSLDGTTFETVGEVAGHGNSTVTIDYGFTDANLSSHGVSVIYYRLKQIDVDGNHEYSNIASVDVKSAQQIFHIISTYPNPFADHFSVSFYAPGAESVRVSVYDVRGALVSEEMVNAETGMNVYSIAGASKLASGFYTMNISAGGKNYSVKMLKGEK